ncbi:MAG: PRC-barrel domain-containing protein [Verrucomicrobiota bacterium]
MKILRRISVAAAMGALSLALFSGARAQEADANKADQDQGNPPPLQSTDRYDINKDRDLTDDRDTADRQHTGVPAANKASGLIGMQVKNHQNENLGEIKDLVIDLPSGKVSYAVLAVGGFLGIGEKLLAIPPSAFTVSGDDRMLMLNADKSKIESAPGFARTNWPDVRNPSWGAEAFWKEGADVDVDADVDIDKDKSELDIDVNRDVELKGEIDRDKGDLDLKGEIDQKKFNNDDRNFQGANKSTDRDYAADEKRLTFKGTIKSVDAEKRMITVESGSDSKDFYLQEDVRIIMARNANAKLVDLKPGYSVVVGYHKDSEGSNVAHSVSKTDRP